MMDTDKSEVKEMDVNEGEATGTEKSEKKNQELEKEQEIKESEE